MVMQTRELNAVAPPSGRLQCWVESLLLGLGMPAAIWAVSRLLTLSIPAAVHGSPEQRFFYWLIAGAIVEWLFVAVLWFVLRRRKLSLSSFGVWRFGTWSAWLVALLIAFLTIASNLRFFPRMHIPITNAFFPHGFHLLAALTIGITAGFCEEVLFRAFLMTQFANAGYGRLMQVLMPGVAFGLSHAGYLNQGFLCLARHCGAHCNCRDDLGYCLPARTPQSSSDDGRSLPE